MYAHRLPAAVAVAAFVVLLAAEGASVAANKPPVPDLTQGGKPDDNHDWTLGPTGARGWIWGWDLETTDSRQILVTQVDRGSPADGVPLVDDVILGVDGKPFTEDARKSFGRAITEAERPRNKGILKLPLWRKGGKRQVQVKLKVLGEPPCQSSIAVAGGCLFIRTGKKLYCVGKK